MKHTKPFATTATNIAPLLAWLEVNLQSIAFGKAGLVFTVHDHHVVGVEKVLEEKFKM